MCSLRPTQEVDPGEELGTESATETDAAGPQAVDSAGIRNAQNMLVTATSLLDMGFQTSNGRILFVTVEYGGFLEIGDAGLPVPLNSEFVFGEGLGDSMLETAPTVDAASYGAGSLDSISLKDWNTHWEGHGFTVTEAD